MAVIDIGYGAANGDTAFISGNANIDLTNPANDMGTLDTFELFYNSDAAGVKVGTFYGSSTKWTNRDYESIGNVTSGSKQTFSGKNCDVETNDCIGEGRSSGQIEANTTGGSGRLYYTGDPFGSGEKTYTLQADRWVAMYATGTTPVVGGLAKKHHYSQKMMG